MRMGVFIDVLAFSFLRKMLGVLFVDMDTLFFFLDIMICDYTHARGCSFYGFFLKCLYDLYAMMMCMLCLCSCGRK